MVNVMGKMILLAIALLAGSTSAFIGGVPGLARNFQCPASRLSLATSRPSSKGHILRASSPEGENLRPDVAQALEEMAAEANGLIEGLVKENKVMLFMKGNKMFPQCGFSNSAVQVLRACDVEFETYDVLSNPAVREKIKEFSNWPTIPQLYVDGEFTGGADIMIESFQSGELKTMLKEAGAKFVGSSG